MPQFILNLNSEENSDLFQCLLVVPDWCLEPWPISKAETVGRERAWGHGDPAIPGSWNGAWLWCGTGAYPESRVAWGFFSLGCGDFQELGGSAMWTRSDREPR